MSPERLVVLAPNWLGDVVMALPAIADVRRACASSTVFVAAREAVAGVLPYIPDIDGRITFAAGTPRSAQARLLANERFDAALLLPNSFNAAWLVWRAAIRQRWGYRGDGRSLLLTRAVARPRWPYRHVEYYQGLAQALGMPSGPPVPRLAVPAAVRAAADDLLRVHGHHPSSPLVVIAPGAAYGTAKQWIPTHVTTLVERLATEGMTVALVGSMADVAVTRAIETPLSPTARARVINLVGETTMEMLVGVVQAASVMVGNDSGATHLAAALGTPVVATFGPTNEHHSPPLAHPESAAVVLTHHVWCRPCMLRECPIDHSCMTGITPGRVHEAVVRLLDGHP